MATLEKLVKALDTLKLVLTSASAAEEPLVRCKQKVTLCVQIADMICAPESRSAQNFPQILSFSLEILLEMCNDQDSNIRMIVDECLNRIIRAMMDSNIVKVQVELRKEIVKNGNPRSLRAALWRFAELAFTIRPNIVKPHIQVLVPALMEIAKRKEESVLETLAAAIPKMFAALGCFTTNDDIRKLLHEFLQNVTSEQAVVRRTAAISILNICLHCSKTQFFLIYMLNTLLDNVLPVKSEQNTYAILGILNCMRGILAHLDCESKEMVLRGSFGLKRKQNKQATLSVDTMIQVYELCLLWTHHSDHNIVTAALETLNQLLTTPPPQLVSVLLSPQGLGRSRIHAAATSRLSSRSLSEVSVASTLQYVDDSQLLESEETIPLTSLTRLQDNEVLLNQPIFPVITSQTTADDGDTESESLASEDVEALLKEVPNAPSPEPEISRDSPSPPPNNQQIMQAWDIGKITESNQCALVYCARRLVTAFLIPDCGPSVRVSVRALAIGCLSQVLRLYPQVFSITIDKNGLTTPQGFSHISDVLCFSTHSDQQLRGLTQVLISFLIHARLEQGWSNIVNETCITEKGTLKNKKITLANLVEILLEGLSDESSVCVRHTLGALSICLADLLENCYSVSFPLLEKLLSLGSNPYWLVKVKLADLICNLNYQCIYYMTESSNYQSKVIDSVVLALLADEDSRVRKATAEGITRLVENLYFPVDYGQDDVAVARGTNISRKLFSDMFEIHRGQSSGPLSRSTDMMIENNLSRLVQVLSQNLLESSSKHFSNGCIEALSLLSDRFPTTLYPVGWQCYLEDEEMVKKSQASASNGLLAIVSALLTASPLSLDLETHQWLLKLAGNLFAGLTLCHTTKGDHNPEGSQIWSTISDKKLAIIAENLLQHVIRLVYIFVKILEDTAHSRSIGGSPLKRRPTRGTSPSKQTSTPEKEGIKEEKGRPYGYFQHIPHCVKLYDLIRSAYTNYRISLDSGASEKFLSLIHCVLNCLEKLLCQAGVLETGRIAEEILLYLRVIFILDSTATIKVVNQLLESLFEANFGAQKGAPGIEESRLHNKHPTCGFYENILHLPLKNMEYHLDIYTKTPHEMGRGSRGMSIEKPKIPHKQCDIEALAANIKLFEPIVIQGLREYTKTSNVRLQVEVLRLLTQLVQLKVNYLLLDSDQVFIQFVLKQFEFLEAGQTQHADLLIPQVFKFLVHLSNERNHSKQVISVSEIIQLCDRLMASGQNPITHSVPALMPVVEHVFLLNASTTSDIKELEAQREVTLSMLLRLAEYPQVMNILYKIMSEGWRWEEQWRNWYKQSVETILPLLAEGRLLIDKCSILHGLLNLNSSFSSPVDNLLMLLFTHQQEGQATVHWLGMVTTMMSSICMYKEDWIFLQLEQLNLYVKEEGDDPLNVNTVSKTLPPQSLMAKLILRVIKSTILKLENLQQMSFETEKVDGIEKLLSQFMLCCIYITQPGNFDKVKQALSKLLELNLEVHEINRSFINVAQKCPVLTLLWAHLLVLSDQGERDIWSELMRKGPKYKNITISKSVSARETSLNLEVVKRGSILLYCEYLAKNPSDVDSLEWFIGESVKDIIWHCQEAPVEKLLHSIYNIEQNSKLLLDTLSKCISKTQSVFTHRLLHTLGYIHSNYTGAVLRLVATSLIEHQNIAIARLATSFCSRTLEYMLTLDSAGVQSQMSRDQLISLLESLTASPKQSKRHSGLISLLNKLGIQNFDVSPCELEYGRSVNAAHIRSIVLDKSWVLSQVKDKCCYGADTNGRKCARLLSELEADDIATILNCTNFDINILQHCFTLGSQITLEYCLKHPGAVPFENLTPLYLAARKTLLNLIAQMLKNLPEPYDVYNPSSPLTSNRSKLLDNLFNSSKFRQSFLPLVPAVSNYLTSIPSLTRDSSQLKNILPSDSWDVVADFGVSCMEMANWLILIPSGTNNMNWPSSLQYLVESAAIIFHLDVLTSKLSYMHISSICNSIFSLLKMVTGEEIPLKVQKNCAENSEESQLLMKTCLQMASLISWVELNSENRVDIPDHIYQCTRSLIVSLGRNDKLNWFCRTPVEAWQMPFNLECPPPLPLPLLHDSDILKQIVFRISLLGWTGRLQFEETWVCLLSALSPNPDIDATDQDEISVIMQANSIAVDGITWLVLSALAADPGNPNSSTLLHIPRHSNSKIYSLSCWKRLEEMNESLCWKLNKVSSSKSLELVRIDKRPNLERGNNRIGYSFGQLSVQYLQTQITPPEERAELDLGMNSIVNEKEKSLSESGLDLRSCTQFLLDLFSQWTLPNSGISLNLHLSMVKSILSLSDIFSERSHYVWMLDTLLDMSKIHPQYDEVLHQYLVIGICKAAAVLNSFEGEVGERVFKMLEQALKSNFAPLRSAGLHGLLYLLQSIQFVKEQDLTSDVVQKFGIQEFRQKTIQISIDYFNKHFSCDPNESLEDILLGVSVVVYFLEYFPEEISNTQLIMTYLTNLIKNPKNHNSYQAVMQGLERLVLVGRADLSEQITRLALDRFSQSDPCITLPALQLLLACIYSDQKEDGTNNKSDNTERTMEIMEKTSALFDRIKKGYPVEVEVVCEILPRILSDFFPASDILTKVIGEFLSPNQPHKRNMAAMVFQVFTQACSEKQLPLLQDWVVHSLSNFTSNLPVVMAVWSLCCFFISASANPWLKAIFPHVQSRIRQCDYEDRKILCIAAIDFYQQLSDKQKELFLQSFKETSSNQKSPFADVIACL